MYKIEQYDNMWKMDQKVYSKKMDAEIELKKLEMTKRMMDARAYEEKEQSFRLKIGLTNLEGDANILRDALLKRQLELADAVEMGKNNYVVKKAKLEVSNTRIMYNEVRKKIFTICLKHGVKSEHSD